MQDIRTVAVVGQPYKHQEGEESALDIPRGSLKHKKTNKVKDSYGVAARNETSSTSEQVPQAPQVPLPSGYAFDPGQGAIQTTALAAGPTIQVSGLQSGANAKTFQYDMGHHVLSAPNENIRLPVRFKVPGNTHVINVGNAAVTGNHNVTLEPVYEYEPDKIIVQGGDQLNDSRGAINVMQAPPTYITPAPAPSYPSAAFGGKAAIPAAPAVPAWDGKQGFDKQGAGKEGFGGDKGSMGALGTKDSKTSAPNGDDEAAKTDTEQPKPTAEQDIPPVDTAAEAGEAQAPSAPVDTDPATTSGRSPFNAFFR